MNSITILTLVAVLIIAVNTGSPTVHRDKNWKDKVRLIFFTILPCTTLVVLFFLCLSVTDVFSLSVIIFS